MDVQRSPEAFQAAVSRWKDRGWTVGLVPTMGALHAGHLSLIRRARRENRKVVVSIFVNPLQFGPDEGYARYPRSFADDNRLCEASGVDLLFAPSADKLYPEGFATKVTPGPISTVLEGEARPGHFDGVATVVLKLLMLAQPDKAYFGEKDYQQLKVIERVARDLHLPHDIIPCATVREKDGLALSSRNQFLDARQRAQAPALYALLQEAKALAHKRGSKPGAVARRLRRKAERIPGFRLDYLRIVDSDDLKDAPSFRVSTRALVAGWFGSTRLIDNLALNG